MILIIVLVLVLNNVRFLTARLDQDLIADYCKAKSLTMGTIFTCQSKTENVRLSKFLAILGLRFLIIDLQEEITNFAHILDRKYYNFAVILDGDCDISPIITLDKMYFYETYHWLISSKKNTPEIIQELNNAQLNINSDINLINLSAKTDNFPVLDVYNPASAHQGQLITTNLGYYSPEQGFQAKFKSNKYWIRKNMSGVKFTSAIVVPDDRISFNEYISSDKNRQLNSMHRFQHVTITYFKEFFNFSLEIKRTDSWGYISPITGKFDGLVGMLARREVDFGSSPLIYKLDRMPVVDYSFGNWILKSTFIYRKPRIVEPSHVIFMRPFSTTIWVLIALTMGVLMVFLKVMFSRELRLLKQLTNDAVDSSWSFLFLFTLGAFCQQGATCYPQLLSSRTLSVFVFLFCILIYQFYSASIVSYLLMDAPRRINNLQDLSDSELNAGIEDILIDRNYFVQTTDPAAIRLFKEKINKGGGEYNGSSNSGFYQPDEGVELVRRGGFAFHVETSSAYPIIENTYTNEEICDLEEVQMYRTQPMHANLQKHSPFREIMNYFMIRLREDGNMYRLRKFWDARKPTCIESAKHIEIHVSLNEFSAGLIALTWGITFAVFFLILEFIVYYKHKILLLFKYNKFTVVKPYTH